MLAYGATFDLTPHEKGMKGAIERALELLDRAPRGPGCPSSSRTRPTSRSTPRPPRRRSYADFNDSAAHRGHHRRRHGRPHHRPAREELKRRWPDAEGLSPWSRPFPRDLRRPARPACRSRASARASSPPTCTRSRWTARSRSSPRTPRKWPAAPRARKACSSASPAAPPSPAIAAEARRSWPTSTRVLGFNYDTGP